MDDQMTDDQFNACLASAAAAASSLTEDDQLCEVATELGIDHHGGNGDIIASIKKLQEENKALEVSLDIVKVISDGLEVNKANMIKFMEENSRLQEENKALEVSLDIVKAENEVNKTNMIKFMEENVKLKEENFKYAEIMGQIDGDQLTDFLQDHGWVYNEHDAGELVRMSEEEWQRHQHFIE